MNESLVSSTAMRLVNSRAELLEEYPFFGRLLLRLPFALADCETAYTDMSRIVFDPSFASRLNDEQLKFVILHELMHCVLKHCTRGKGKLHKLYNIACDIVVNSILLEAMNLKDITIDGTNIMHLAPNRKEGKNYSAEEIYDMLIKDVCENLKNHGEYSLFDNHDIWEQITSEQMLEEIWNNYIKQSSKGVGKGSGIPDSLKRVIVSIEHSSKISWKHVLHDYIQNKNSDFVFSPPDKRYSEDFILPSFQENIYGSSLENIWYVVDTSGSVSDTEISEAFFEIKDAIEQIENVEGIVSFFDCEITEPIPFNTIEDIEKITPTGGGGTSFKAIFDYLGEKLINNLPRVIVIITDGYAEFPDKDSTLDVPIIWLIVNSDVEPPFGEILHISTNK